jgi:hypothetical protein
MSIAYHVDRSNLLSAGDELTLEDDLYVNPTDRVVLSDTEKETLSERYPDGLSRHGARYASVAVGSNDIASFTDDTKPLVGVREVENASTGEKQKQTMDPVSANYEWMFEMIRLSEFPDRPSRFQSFFGFETYEAAQKFAQGTRSQILKIEYQQGFRADMNLLSFSSFPNALQRGTRYWKGESGANDPNWEVLMQEPVTVLDTV